MSVPRRRSTLSHSTTAAQLVSPREPDSGRPGELLRGTTAHVGQLKQNAPSLPRANSGSRPGSNVIVGRFPTNKDSKKGKRVLVGSGSLDATKKGSSERSADFVVHELFEKRLFVKVVDLAKQRRIELSALQMAASKRASSEFINILVLSLPTHVTLVHELVRYCSGETILWLLQYYGRVFERREGAGNMLPSHAIAVMRQDNDSEPLLQFWRALPLQLLNKTDGEKLTVGEYLAIKKSNAAVRIVQERLQKSNPGAAYTTSELLLEITTKDLERQRIENRRLAHNTEQAEQNAEDLRVMHREMNDAIESRDAELASLRAQLTTVNHECDKLREQCDQLNAQTRAQDEQLNAARRVAERARKDATDAQRNAQDVVDRLAGAEVRARKLDDERKVLMERITDVEDRLAQAPNPEAEAERDRLHNETLAKLDYEIKYNRHECQQLSDQCAMARSDEQRLRAALEKSNGAYATARAEASVLRERTQMLVCQLAAQSAQLESLRAPTSTPLPIPHLSLNTNNHDADDGGDDVMESAEEGEEEKEKEGEGGELMKKKKTSGKKTLHLRKQLRDRERELTQLREQLQANIAQTATSVTTPRLLPPPPLNLSTKITLSDDKVSSTSASVGASTMNLLRNQQLNEPFYTRLYTAVRTGDTATLTQYFTLGVSPNTRDDSAQPLLEIAVRAAFELRNTKNVFSSKELSALTLSLNKSIRVIIENGGDWEHLEAFLREHGGDDHSKQQLPSSTIKLLNSRDDFSPFCIALLNNDEARAGKFLECVENFNRIPSLYKKEAYTYLHLAIIKGSALLVQGIVLSGRVDVNRRDAKDRAPLHLAIQKCSGQTRELIVQYLLAGGAYPFLTCTHAPLLRRTCEALKKRSAKYNTQILPRTPLLGNHRIGVATGSGVGGDVAKASAKELQNAIVRRSQDALQFGKPEAMARAVGAENVLNMLTSRRYLRLTVVRRDAEEHGLPLLQEYIGTWVRMHVLMRRLLECKRVNINDSIYTIFTRYADVFACFNVNYHSDRIIGYDGVLTKIYEAAGVSDRVACDEETRAQALRVLVEHDEALIITAMRDSGVRQRKQEGGDDESSALTANANHVWELCKMLMQCTKAVSEQWFEVSNLIRQSTATLYDRAAADTLRSFVLSDAREEINWMLSRSDNLFGALDVNSVIDEKNQFTAIQLAAHSGVTRVLEYLMERQRQRIDTTDAHGRTLITIALAASQPISVVCIDWFRFSAGMSTEKHPNQCHYALLHKESGNSVLHQCARSGRFDLIEFCLEYVRYQITLKNNSGETPVDVARTMLKMHAKNPDLAPHYQQCVDVLES